MKQSTNIRRGIFFILLSSFSFALMGMFVHAAGDLPFVQKAFFRNIIAAVFAAALLIKSAAKDKSVLHIPPRALPFLILRALCGTVGIFGNFYALDHLPISDASLLNKMSPFFSILASFIFLGEKISIVQLLAICVVFLGSLLVIKPSFHFFASLPGLAGFLGGMGAGFAYAFVRKCHTYKVNGYMIILTFSLFSCIVSLPFMILHYAPMTMRQILLLIGAGLAASGGQFGITGAYFNAPAAKISIYEYSMIIFSAILGFVTFGQVPDVWSILGYAIIIGVALALFFYNSKKECVC